MGRDSSATKGHRGSETSWLVVKSLVFTLLVPTTVVGLVPYLILGDAFPGALDLFGVSLLGVLPIALGGALYIRCAFAFVWNGRGTPVPLDPPVELVVEGPYRYCRNPMYVGILAIVGGEAMLFRDSGLLVFLLLAAVGFHTIAIGYEERVLGRRFGEAYARYRSAVPRWIPRWRALEELYGRTFLKVGAALLTAGVVAHVLRLSIGLPVVEMPSSVHAFLVVLSAYAATGCVVHARRIDLPGPLRKCVFGVIVMLLVLTLVLHAYSLVTRENHWLGVFPMWYSWLATIVYGGFAYFLKTRRLDGPVAGR